MVLKIIKNRLGNQFRRITIDRYPFIFRPSSKPFLSGDSLRAFSDHIFDESKSFNPNKVKKLNDGGLKVMKTIKLKIKPNEINKEYFNTKKIKSNHIF